MAQNEYCRMNGLFLLTLHHQSQEISKNSAELFFQKRPVKMKPLQLNSEEHGQTILSRNRRSSLNGAGIIDSLDR